MSEEQVQDTEVQEETAPESIDMDQKFKIDGQEYSAQELAQAKQQLEVLQAQNEKLHAFRDSTMRLMDPDVAMSSKKIDARNMLLEAGYDQQQVEEWVKVYDEEETLMDDNEQTSEGSTPEMRDLEARQQAAKMQQEIDRIRAHNLKSQMESTISSAISSNEDSKILLDWIETTRSSDELSGAKDRITEQVRAKALENLRRRRDQAGTFDESWVADEVNKAATQVSKDMLTVIGDTSKIGRVSETAGQTETLSRRKPVELPDNKGKSFGEVEGQLRDWTTDQILRSLSDLGGDSKA